MSALLDELIAIEPESFNEIEEKGPPPVTDVAGARRLMIAIAKTQKEKEDLKKLLKAITEQYQAQIGKVEEREALLRQSLETFIRDINGGEKLSLPDVGTAYLAKRKAKVQITNKALVQHHYGDKFTKTVFDETAFKEHALRYLHETGEVIEGVEYIPEHTALQIRGV